MSVAPELQQQHVKIKKMFIKASEVGFVVLHRAVLLGFLRYFCRFYICKQGSQFWIQARVTARLLINRTTPVN